MFSSCCADKNLTGQPLETPRWELTKPIPLDDEGSSRESAIGKSPDVHYIYVCIKVCVSRWCFYAFWINQIASGFYLKMSNPPTLFQTRYVFVHLKNYLNLQDEALKTETEAVLKSWESFLVLFAFEHIGPTRNLVLSLLYLCARVKTRWYLGFMFTP